MNSFWKDIIREIKYTAGRFISLLIIAALGSASIVGIQASAIDMRSTADRMYKEHNLYDLQLKSTIGFDDEDIRALGSAEGVRSVMPAYTFDVFVYLDNVARSARTYSLPDTLNMADVLEGRLPEKAGECAVEMKLYTAGEFRIGDKISFTLDDMDDYFSVLSSDEFTIVGVVYSPLYISMERGNTSLGNGSLSYYLLLHPEAYTLGVYTDAYVAMAESAKMDNLTDEYNERSRRWMDMIKLIGEERIGERRDELLDAQKEIDDGWKEYNDGVNELDEKIADAKRELDDAERELEDARIKLTDGQRTLDSRIAESWTEINAGQAELDAGQVELDTQRQNLEDAQLLLNASRQRAETALADLETVWEDTPAQRVQYETILESLRRLDELQVQLDQGFETIENAQKEIDAGANALNEARWLLESERRRAQAEINNGWASYYEGLEEYNEGRAKLETEEADALAELEDARNKLIDAQKELDDVPTPEWYYFNRENGLAFDSYYQDTLRLQKVGYVFPMVFLLVAILVSLTSMSRMVEEHRTQIGVYKALGYNSAAIMLKYVIYALGASLSGGMIGVLVGSKLFPRIITDAYGYLYDMPPVETPVPVAISALAVTASIASVLIVTIFTFLRSMRGTPALLMRPKSPPAGKRVFLERTAFIWNRLGFIGKVTARNIFRYKKRFFMTLIGIAGCTALLVTAFGLRDSIDAVALRQYGEIAKYSLRAYTKNITSKSQRAELDLLLPEASLFVHESSVDAEGPEGAVSASLYVPERHEDLGGFFHLFSPKSGETVVLGEDGVLLTEKLARMIGVSAGDDFSVTVSGEKKYAAKVTGIVENYIFHYVYMSPEVYSEIFGKDAVLNSVFVFAEDTDGLSEKLLGSSNVMAAVDTARMLKTMRDSTDALGVVTVVLIALACALAFVVLFNLTTINISERLRELATIKVLGFYELELAMYIYRENAWVTFMGIALGVVGGIYLNEFVLSSVEIDVLKFPHEIRPVSFAVAVLLSLAFAVLVNWIMNYKLKRIDMVESLKNVE